MGHTHSQNQTSVSIDRNYLKIEHYVVSHGVGAFSSGVKYIYFPSWVHPLIDLFGCIIAKLKRERNLHTSRVQTIAGKKINHRW